MWKPLIQIMTRYLNSRKTSTIIVIHEIFSSLYIYTYLYFNHNWWGRASNHLHSQLSNFVFPFFSGVQSVVYCFLHSVWCHKWVSIVPFNFFYCFPVQFVYVQASNRKPYITSSCLIGEKKKIKMKGRRKITFIYTRWTPWMNEHRMKLSEFSLKRKIRHDNYLYHKIQTA